jgi:hypothetical protein
MTPEKASRILRALTDVTDLDTIDDHGAMVLGSQTFSKAIEDIIQMLESQHGIEHLRDENKRLRDLLYRLADYVSKNVRTNDHVLAGIVSQAVLASADKEEVEVARREAGRTVQPVRPARNEEEIREVLRRIKRNEAAAEKERADLSHKSHQTRETQASIAACTDALLSFEGATVALLWVLGEVETPLTVEFVAEEEGHCTSHNRGGRGR